MAADGTEQHVTLKLMVMKGKKKVVIAEAGKEFVDILFSFLTLPLGTIARLVREESKVEPPELALLRSLHQSVENLDNGYLCTDACREMLLRPRNSMEAYCRRLKLNIDDTEPTEYFVCNNLIYCSYTSPVLLSSFKNKQCRCGRMLAKPISAEASCVFDGFVKSNSRFMITDDLKVIPNSMDKIVNVLKNSGIKSMSSVNVMSVNITKNQVIYMLKCCLYSKTVLTDLFLEKLPREILHKRERIVPSDFKANENDSGKITVKIMQRKSNGKIVFAEGKEDFANFLFNLLTIPIGGAVDLMEGCSCVGSLDGLYNSFIDLDEDYFTTKVKNNKFVDPVLAPQLKLDSLLPLTCDYVPEYFCYVNIIMEDYYLTSVCKSCVPYLERCVPVEFVDSISYTNNNDKGYLKGPTTYMVTDDLVVTPSSSISVMFLVSSMSIPVDDLQEKVVSIGTEECVRILQASLSSTSALTLGLSHLTEVKEDN
ncbi:uncharacterized protein LOC106770153 [Vigna radiata var. radiata]|uniref:Uncharacterized protein LOC106770153 n=1 Tax=Vigna radiata var. radiata TaxID=3916 RepID=A0A1S3UZU4_VIGRR|nr:uncharacterized protein LOC106770153 [Vigna radiata var. radiata]